MLLIYLLRRTDYESKGLVHPSKQSNNAVLQRVLLTVHLKQSSEHRLLFCTIHVTFSHTNNTAVRKSAVSIATRLHPLLNNCVLFALVKLAFVALLSENILGFGSRVAFTFRAVNTIMQKGCSHLLASITPKH